MNIFLLISCCEVRSRRNPYYDKYFVAILSLETYCNLSSQIDSKLILLKIDMV